jgi:hypothetical protein
MSPHAIDYIIMPVYPLNPIRSERGLKVGMKSYMRLRP